MVQHFVNSSLRHGLAGAEDRARVVPARTMRARLAFTFNSESGYSPYSSWEESFGSGLHGSIAKVIYFSLDWAAIFFCT